MAKLPTSSQAASCSAFPPVFFDRVFQSIGVGDSSAKAKSFAFQ
jgi:hypothetical protein